MGQGAFINVKNWTSAPVTVSVSNVSDMDNGADPNALSGTLAPGGSVPSDALLYIESSGFLTVTSTFNITVADLQGNVLGTLGFTESSNLYSLAQPPVAGSQVVVNWFNPTERYGNQAFINVSVLPFGYDAATWMTQATSLGNLQLGNIAAPGSHDAGTYSYTGIAASEVVTQSYSIGQQLTLGARYFDVRPGGELDTANLLGTTLYHVHGGFECAPFSDILNDIANFAQANPREIIYLALSHFDPKGSGPAVLPQLNNGNNPSDPNIVLSYIVCYQLTQALGPWLLPNTVRATDTLQSIWDQYAGKNIVVFMDLPVVNAVEVAFGSGPNQINIPAAQNSVQLMSSGPVANWGSYADTGDISTLVSWVQNNIPQSTMSSWNLLQCQLTGDFGTFFETLLLAAQSSNIAIRQLLDFSFAPTGPWAEMFAATGNFVLLDNIDGTTTPWPVLTNMQKLFGNAAPAAAALNGSLVAVKKGAAGDNAWFPLTSLDGNTWTGGGTLTGGSTAVLSFAAAMASSGTELCLAYLDIGSTNISVLFSSTGKATDWSVSVQLPGSVNTLQAPAPVYFNGTPWVFYHGSGDSFIWYSYASNGTWQDATPLPPSVNTSHSPAPVAFQGGLSVVFKGALGDNRIFIIQSPDGLQWPNGPQPLTSPVPTEPIETWTAPAAAQLAERLYVAWKGAVNANLYYASSADGVTWTAPAQVPGATAGASPALAVYGNQLFVLFEPMFRNDELMACATSDGTTWGPLTRIV